MDAENVVIFQLMFKGYVLFTCIFGTAEHKHSITCLSHVYITLKYAKKKGRMFHMYKRKQFSYNSVRPVLMTDFSYTFLSPRRIFPPAVHYNRLMCFRDIQPRP